MRSSKMECRKSHIMTAKPLQKTIEIYEGIAIVKFAKSQTKCETKCEAKYGGTAHHKPSIFWYISVESS